MINIDNLSIFPSVMIIKIFSCNAYLLFIIIILFSYFILFFLSPQLFAFCYVKEEPITARHVVSRRDRLQLDHSISRERVLNRQSRIIADSHRQGLLLIKTLPIIWQLVVRCCHGIADHSNPFFSRSSSLSCPPSSSSSPATKSLFNRCEQDLNAKLSPPPPPGTRPRRILEN